MQFLDPGKPFFKGNLHAHTTRSDGKLTPEECIALYRSHGYAFLALTDHRVLGEPTHTEDGMLLLCGMEMDFRLPGEALHLVGFGLDPDYVSKHDLAFSPQHCVNVFNRSGGRTILCHPAWSMNTMATMCSLEGIFASEVYNSCSTYPWNAERADSSLILDLCANHGTRFRFVASDDAHNYNGDACVSSTVVQAEELTPSAIFAAMEAGHSYCTTGPQFFSLEIRDHILQVTTSPVEHILFPSNIPWQPSRCVSGHGITSAEYDLSSHRGDSYIRVQLVDANGRSAWSNPIARDQW